MAENTNLIPRAPKGGLQGYLGGVFIPKALWEREKKIAESALPGLCQDLSEDVQLLIEVAEDLGTRPPGAPAKMTIEKLDARLTAKLRRAYAEAFRLGKRASGNFLSVTDSEAKQLSKVRADEYKYARKFLRDAFEGRGRVPYEQRSEMYGNALKEAYWLGYLLGNASPSRRIKWVKSARDSCSNCIEYDAHPAYTVKEFISGPLSKGHLPRSGNLECLGILCGCELKESFVKSTPKAPVT